MAESAWYSLLPTFWCGVRARTPGPVETAFIHWKLPYACAAPTFPSISCGSSCSKVAAEIQRFSNRGSESSPQPPPYQSQASGSNSMLASSAIHSEPGSKASKTVDEAASAAVSATEACGDDAADVKYCDPFDTGPAAVALGFLRAEEQRNKSSPPAHATPAAGRAPSADEMVHSPVLLLLGLQPQPRAGPLHPVPSSSSSSGVSVATGRKGGITGEPSLRHACCLGPPPHQGSGGSTSASSVQQRPAPAPRGSSSHGGGVSGFRSMLSDNVSSSSFADNSPGRPDEKRGCHGPLQSVATGSSHVASTTTPLRSGSDCALQSFRASPSIHNLSSCSCDGPRRSEKRRGGLVVVAPPIVQQPAPTPRVSSSSGGGNPSVPIPATRDHGLAFKQAPVAIDQSHPLPRSPISKNSHAAGVGAVAVKRSILAGVKVLPSESVRRPRSYRRQNLRDCRNPLKQPSPPKSSTAVQSPGKLCEDNVNNNRKPNRGDHK
ncbi:hypothetical protein HPB49_012483 [Dermacentor silvarum]|uniref:Uncharacterized protein n=1 Tax=Dermacentor silvarum TaxID=543639 RepID=A0ACB8CKW0_DERSI|nr:hypothetical protein HPB49_012483 [Dermacentor silvarum]